MASQEAPHIGHLIKEELARQERTVAWLARKLCCSRQNVYHLFECQWMSTYHIDQTLVDLWKQGLKNE